MPTKTEANELNLFYKSLIKIKNTNDIIALQNYTIDHISHDSSSGSGEINIIQILKTKKGLCFHRSLILQKVMLLNGLRIRPVFLYSKTNNTKTEIYDLFSKYIYSHNIFEFFWQGQWYVMETNEKMRKNLTLNEYLITQKIYKNKTRFIRHLNNRNGKFIYPFFIPDIY